MHLPSSRSRCYIVAAAVVVAASAVAFIVVVAFADASVIVAAFATPAIAT